MKIRKEIKGKLLEIEKKERVRIIKAVESGSRAWGFASPDSDYDVRFIYVRQEADYLMLNEKRDVIEWQLDERLDINGWDVKKALRQAYKGNAVLFEWALSPIVYRTTAEWDIFWEVLNQYFDAKALIGHYYGTALNTWKCYLNRESVRYKKYFYALRPLLACRYIETYKTAPPMKFEDLCIILPEELKQPVDRLLEIKQETNEANTGEHISVIDDFIKTELESLHEMLESINSKTEKDWEPLNNVFRRLVCEVLNDTFTPS